MTPAIVGLLKISLVLWVLVFSGAFCRPGYAAEPEQEEPTQLEKIQAEVDKQNERLAAFERDIANLESALIRSRDEVAAVQKQEELLLAELTGLSQRVESSEDTIAATDMKINSYRRLSQNRIRALYMTRGSTMTAALLLEPAGLSSAQNAYYLAKVRAYDRQLLHELEQMNRQQRKARKELLSLVKEQQKVEGQLTAKKAVLQERLRKQSSILDERRQTRLEAEEVLVALRAQALRLETVVISLTGGDADTRSLPRRADDKVVDQVDTPSFDGSGLPGPDELVVPVKGKVVKHFGRWHHAEFKDYVFSKGVEFSAESEQAVLAIAGARVIYVGRMPGYGTILILDHGRRFYSLYGRLSEIRVQQGDIVESGQLIATAGKTENELNNFYFEIRRDGKPVNPQDYFDGKL